jgi:hypothetical protein
VIQQPVNLVTKNGGVTAKRVMNPPIITLSLASTSLSEDHLQPKATAARKWTRTMLQSEIYTVMIICCSTTPDLLLLIAPASVAVPAVTEWLHNSMPVFLHHHCKTHFVVMVTIRVAENTNCKHNAT